MINKYPFPIVGNPKIACLCTSRCKPRPMLLTPALIWHTLQTFFTASARGYWMIYRGPGFIAVVRFCSSLTLVFSYPASKLSFFLSLAVCHWSLTAYWRYWRERGGVGAKSYDGEKAWSSLHHSILSVSAILQSGYPNTNSLPPSHPMLLKNFGGKL